MSRYFWDGSYTVEAAFLIPMILGVTYAWMFQLFYLRDQVVMNGMLEEMVIEAQSDRGWDEEQEDGKMEAGAQPGREGDREQEDEDMQELQDHLWIADIHSMIQTKDLAQTKYKIRASAVWDIPVMEQFLGSRFSSSLTKRLDRMDPETVLRIAGRNDDRSGSKK